MSLVEKLKGFDKKEFVLPAAGVVNAAILTIGAGEASAFLSHYISSNFIVGGIVVASEIAVMPNSLLFMTSDDSSIEPFAVRITMPSNKMAASANTICPRFIIPPY